MKSIKTGVRASVAVGLVQFLCSCAPHGEPSVAQKDMAKGFFWFSFFLAVPLAAVIANRLGGKPAEALNSTGERSLLIAITVAIMSIVYLFIRFVIGIDIAT